MEGSLGGALAGVFLLTLFQLCGLCAARLFLPEESAGARLLLGSVTGSLLLQWLPVPFAFFLGFSQAAHLCAAGAAVLLGGACLWLNRAGKQKHLSALSTGPLSAFGRHKFLWAVLLMTLFYWFLVWKSFLFRDGRIFSSQATYGDMSMHLGFITSIARQQSFPPEYSILPGFLLSYPFLSDSISSSLYLWGCPLKLSYFLPMALAGAQVFFGFYLFAARLLKSGKKAALAWVLFFLNGGFGFVYFLNGTEPFSNIFTEFYHTPTNFGQRIRWVNVVVDMLLPQRATLFGWAVLFSTLYLLYRAVFEDRRNYFLYAGVFGGLLPMIHTHSFLALGLICAVWLLASLLRSLSLEAKAVRVGKALILIGLPAMSLLLHLFRKLERQEVFLKAALAAAGAFVLLLAVLIVFEIRRSGPEKLCATWGVLLLTVCVLALPQLFTWTFGQAEMGGFVRGHLGWVVSEGEDPYLWFYLKNIGLAGLLALGGLLTAKGREFSLAAPALLLWAVAEFVEFQPNNYDNNKLLYVAYALLCCAAADWAVRLLEKLKNRPVRAAVGAVGVFLCTFSAVLTMGREAVAEYELFGEGALSLCEYVEEALPPDALVLTDTRHNNEIAALTGRNILCGSSAYLYFHGLPYGWWEKCARDLYETPTWELFERMGVDYVLVSDFERNTYRISPELPSFGEEVFNDGNRVLYAVRRPG